MMSWGAPTSSWLGLTDLGVILLISVPGGLFTQAIGEPVGGTGFLPWLFLPFDGDQCLVVQLGSGWAPQGEGWVHAQCAHPWVWQGSTAPLAMQRG